MGSAKIGTVRSKGDYHRVPVKGQTLDRKQYMDGGHCVLYANRIFQG